MPPVVVEPLLLPKLSRSDYTKLVDLIAYHGGVNATDIDKNATFKGIGIDSIEVVELVIAVEDAFNIEIPDEDAERHMTSTVETMANYLAKRLYK